MLRRKVAMLLGEPFERDLGFAARARRLLDGPKPFPVLGSHGAVELRPVRAQLAPQPSDGDAEIMKCLAVEAIVQPPLRGTRRSEAFEGQASRGLFVAPKKEIVG
jgi:hypothetical protein